MVVVLVLRRIDQGDWALLSAAAQFPESLGMASKLEAVTAREFVPTANLVPKPAPELRAGRQLAIPLVEPGFLFADPARP